MNDNDWFEQYIADEFARSLVQERKKTKFGIVPEDKTACIVDVLGDLSLANLLCRRYNEIFNNRTFTYKCYIVLEKERLCVNITSFEYFKWFGTEDKVKMEYKVTFFPLDYKVDTKYPKMLVVMPKKSFLDLIHSSPVEWGD